MRRGHPVLPLEPAVPRGPVPPLRSESSRNRVGARTLSGGPIPLQRRGPVRTLHTAPWGLRWGVLLADTATVRRAGKADRQRVAAIPPWREDVLHGALQRRPRR